LRQKPRKVKILHFEIIKFENEFVSQAILQIHTKNALFIRINSLIIPVSKGNEKMKITLNESLIQGTLLINAIGLFNNENRIENIQLKKISIKKSKINILEIKPIVPSSNISLITTFKINTKTTKLKSNFPILNSNQISISNYQDNLIFKKVEYEK
jgi:hypothetical protein